MDLTTQQIDTLRAAVNRIIPPDDFPGGWEGGVRDYLTNQFKRDLKSTLPLYIQGLNALDVEAQAAHKSHFANLDAAQQDTILAAIESGQVNTAWTVEPAQFFKLLVNHTMEGFYSDPNNGGNKDQIAWQMIGFEVKD